MKQLFAGLWKKNYDIAVEFPRIDKRAPFSINFSKFIKILNKISRVRGM